MNLPAIGIALALVTAQAAAQAPVTERSPRAETYEGAQRAIEFTRRYAADADARVREAERAAEEAAAARKAAEGAIADARTRDERARRELDDARRAAADAQAAHRRAGDEFERIRQRSR